jgi:hypothetical protein
MIPALLVSLMLHGGSPLADRLPWDGLTTRWVVDEASGLRLPVPLTGVLLQTRHFADAKPSLQMRHVFTLSSVDGEAVEVGVFENPKQLALEAFLAQTLGYLRLVEHAEMAWTATPAKVPAVLLEHPRTGQQYASRTAVFASGNFIIVVSCRNIEDRFAAGAFAAVLAGLEVKR